MGFNDVRLPEEYSVNSLFGAGFDTLITELRSGAEHRVQLFPDAGRRKIDLAKNLSDLDKLIELKKFHIARKGALNSFRVKDWFDYATNSSGTIHRAGDAAVSASDELLQSVSGNLQQWQLVKRYSSGAQTVVRAITKPVSGSVLVSLDGTPTTNFTVNLNTGIVTLSSDPGASVVRGGCEFDTPCRFTKESDEALQITIDALDAGSLPSITVIEDIDVLEFNQEIDFGGFKDHGVIASDVSVVEIDGRLQRLEVNTASLTLFLPSHVDLPEGGPYFAFYNPGTQAIDINDADLQNLTSLPGSGGFREIWLGKSADTNTKFWVAV